MDDTLIRDAVTAWLDNSSQAAGTYGAIETWCTADVTDMSELFKSASSFNDDIVDWDVSAVTDTNLMFYDAVAFNQDIGNWDVSAVTDMNSMFFGAKAFNRSLSWCVRASATEAFNGTLCEDGNCGVNIAPDC